MHASARIRLRLSGLRLELITKIIELVHPGITHRRDVVEIVLPMLADLSELVEK
jgi:hypothetical protein